MTTGLFLSELDSISRRSIGQRHWEQNADTIAAATSMVLSGDMFDFRWSQFGSLEASLDAAAAWLEKAIALNPSASWVYLLGNHDCHPRIQDLLTSISEQHPTFGWSPTFWRTGSNVFLHGDVLDGIRHVGGQESYRSRFHDEKAKGQLSNLLYSAGLQTRLHGLVPRLRRSRQQTCRTLLEYLKGCETALLPEVRNICSGHTHVPMLGYRFDRFNSHDAGSGIRYSTFTPASFDVS
jgi:hypothetical protein